MDAKIASELYKKKEAWKMIENRTRTHRVQVRLDDDEHDYFLYNLERSGLTMEAYLRTLIMSKIPKTKEVSELDRNILAQLYAIGNNLNQIARRAHVMNVLSPEHYDDSLKEFKSIMSAFLNQ